MVIKIKEISTFVKKMMDLTNIIKNFGIGKFI